MIHETDALEGREEGREGEIRAFGGKVSVAKDFQIFKRIFIIPNDLSYLLVLESDRARGIEDDGLIFHGNKPARVEWVGGMKLLWAWSWLVRWIYVEIASHCNVGDDSERNDY